LSVIFTINPQRFSNLFWCLDNEGLLVNQWFTCSFEMHSQSSIQSWLQSDKILLSVCAVASEDVDFASKCPIELDCVLGTTILDI
jgi:hypothetical protein